MTNTLTTEEQQISAVVHGYAAALRTGDPMAVLAFYTDDPVRFDLAPPLATHGVQVLDAAALQGWFDTFDGPVDTEVRDLTVSVSGTVAFCHSINRLSATPKGTTDHFDLWLRQTLGLVKVDGAWRISHYHSSTPFYMDGSFRAAVDLKP